MIVEKTIQFAVCDKCGFDWALRSVMPKTCGRCKSRLWNSSSQEPQKKELPKISTPVKKELTSVDYGDHELKVEDDFDFGN